MKQGLGLGISLLLLACGGGASPASGLAATSAPARAPAADPSSVCAEVVRVSCEGHLRCCSRAEDRYPTREDCESLLRPLCEQDLSGSAYADGRIAFVPEVQRLAIERLRTAAGTCEPLERHPWQGVFTGTQTEGSDCSPGDADYSALLSCAPGLSCGATGSEGSRACVPAATVGASCGAVECNEGLYCNVEASTGPVCRILLATGQPCNAHAACDTGFCDGQRCSARTAVFQFCDDLTYP